MYIRREERLFRNGDNPADSAATLKYLQVAMKGWKKELPVWITEFGFTTVAGSAGSVPNEQKRQIL